MFEVANSITKTSYFQQAEWADLKNSKWTYWWILEPDLKHKQNKHNIIICLWKEN